MECPTTNTNTYVCDLRASWMHLMRARDALTIADPRWMPLTRTIVAAEALYLDEVNRALGHK